MSFQFVKQSLSTNCKLHRPCHFFLLAQFSSFCTSVHPSRSEFHCKSGNLSFQNCTLKASNMGCTAYVACDNPSKTLSGNCAFIGVYAGVIPLPFGFKTACFLLLVTISILEKLQAAPRKVLTPAAVCFKLIGSRQNCPTFSQC